ncbi:MAG: DegT/DnrJ/EryC1/StrS family aminotransferase [Gemmatimonadaceae bacterium]
MRRPTDAPISIAIPAPAGQPPITVTRPTLPPFEEFVEVLRGVWARNHLTNAGPLVVELERQLAAYLGVRHALFVSNGTIALQLAFRALELAGEVITTPFSYVATTSSLAWEGCTPVFADVEPDTLTLSAERAEAAVTARTSALVATHVYGNPCDIDGLAAVARRHRLRIVYDAAHAFGARYAGRALAAHGDVATLSFHATKLFHTVEGGAVVTDDDEIARRVAYLRNFGHAGYEAFQGIGINGKNSELHAAMGLCLLPRVSEIVAERASISRRYDAVLAPLGTRARRPRLREGTTYNYAYYPVLLPDERAVVAVKAHLEANGVMARRYFYPSLSGGLPYVAPGVVPVARDAAERVLCLPLYTGLSGAQVDRIAGLVAQGLERLAPT